MSPSVQRFRFFLILAIVLALLAGGGWWLFGARKAENPWLTAKVTRMDLEDAVLATGTIEAARLVSVGAQASGQVKALHVKEGDVVKQGQLIAEIDATTQSNTLKNELAALDSLKAQRAALQAALRHAELELARQKEMFAHEATSKAEVQSAENALASAQANLQVNTAETAQANLRIATARANLGYTRIVAPMDGTVVAVVTEEGQTVNAVQSAPTIVKLAKLDVVEIKAEISEADVPRVAPGMPAYFTLLGDADKRYDSTLQSIAPAPASLATETTTTTSSTASAVYYNGVLQAPNPDGKLRISMTAQVSIIAAQAKNALSIPSAALGAKDADGRREVRVLVQQGGSQPRVETRKVKIGLNNRVNAEVLDGLQEGDTVLLASGNSASKTDSGNNNPPPPRL